VIFLVKDVNNNIEDTVFETEKQRRLFRVNRRFGNMSLLNIILCISSFFITNKYVIYLLIVVVIITITNYFFNWKEITKYRNGFYDEKIRRDLYGSTDETTESKD
jgi:hypothetical protein